MSGIFTKFFYFYQDDRSRQKEKDELDRAIALSMAEDSKRPRGMFLIFKNLSSTKWYSSHYSVSPSLNTHQFLLMIVWMYIHVMFPKIIT